MVIKEKRGNMKLYFRLIFLIPMLLSIFPLKAQQQETKKGADNNANQYMNQRSVESLVDAFDSPERDSWQKPDEVIALFGNIAGKKIMDLGAGSGYFTLRLASKGANVISADVSDSFQNSIREKLDIENLKNLSNNIELRKVAYDNPLLKIEEVDGLLIVNSWHHIDNRTEYMQKVLKGVKQGGKIIIIDFKLGINMGPPDSHKLGLKDAIEEIIELEFSELIINKFLLERQYVIIGVK